MFDMISDIRGSGHWTKIAKELFEDMPRGRGPHGAEPRPGMPRGRTANGSPSGKVPALEWPNNGRKATGAAVWRTI